MPYRMKVLHVNGRGEPATDLWVESHDVDAHDGRGAVEFTDDPAKAQTWPSAMALFDAWRRVPSARPLRADGEPNRPMTAITIECEEAT